MKKNTFNNLDLDITTIHSTPIEDELSNQTLIDFFRKFVENNSSEIFRFEINPDLDNPSLEIQIRGIWTLEEIIADSSLITNIQIHLSLDRSFSDVTGSPFSTISSFNTALASEVTSDSDFFFIKVGGTISGSDPVDVYLNMLNEGSLV